MATLFEGVSISGIVKPGQVYMLFDANCGNVSGEIEMMYLVRSERELLKTLQMEWDIVLGTLYKVRKLVRVEKIGEDRHEFRMAIGEDEMSLIPHFLYLHRVKAYPEMLVKIREVFANVEAKPAKGVGLPKT